MTLVGSGLEVCREGYNMAIGRIDRRGLTMVEREENVIIAKKMRRQCDRQRGEKIYSIGWIIGGERMGSHFHLSLN